MRRKVQSLGEGALDYSEAEGMNVMLQLKVGIAHNLKEYRAFPAGYKHLIAVSGIPNSRFFEFPHGMTQRVLHCEQ